MGYRSYRDKAKDDLGKNQQVVEVLLKTQKFHQQCKKICNRWEKSTSSIFVGFGGEKWHEIAMLGRNIPIELLKELAMLRKDFGLGSEWESQLIDYIFYSKSLVPPLNRLNISPSAVSNEIVLKLGAKTTLADIKGLWPVIEEWKKMIFNKDRSSLRRLRNLQRDEDIYKLREQGKTFSAIVEIINSRYPADPVDYDTARKAYVRYKKRLKID